MSSPTSSSLATTPDSAKARAEEIYRAEGLALPPVPVRFSGKWRQVRATEFGTRETDWTLYDLGLFLDEAERNAAAPYFLFGFGGHGFASLAAHYYVVTAQAAIFLQARWGGVVGNAAEDKARYERFVLLASELHRQIEDSVAAKRWPKDKRVIVVQSDFRRPLWAWAPAKAVDAEKIAWQPTERNVLFDVFMETMQYSPTQPS